MITAIADRPAAVLIGPGTERVRVRCLARRGMLHSECEAVDHVRLSPAARFDLVGRGGTEAAWYVLRGSLTLGRAGPVGPDGAPDPQAVLRARSLVLAPRGEDVRLCAGPLGADLLCLTLTPAAAVRRLPPRVPHTTQGAPS
ncbi:hypothetical protein RKE29_22580 [Streptomyces sp. B1866]|uniref:hypothetical protein n=1 Tax=Streptomyces sp. B1866 TaxID=3075431 RepID=UPI00288EC1A7|nr:hypothetical protein [Streptomyces sp. B1866]MDT3399398.1 hypothetical protein [Streptomyces sp. B1866]